MYENMMQENKKLLKKYFYHEKHIPALDSWKSQQEKKRINFTPV